MERGSIGYCALTAAYTPSCFRQNPLRLGIVIEQVNLTYKDGRPRRPFLVATPQKFSTAWKTFSRFFHAMENIFPHCGKKSPNLPRNGKTFSEFSTQWKNFGRFFHAMEKLLGIFPHYGKMFPRCGKLEFRPVLRSF